MPLTGAMYAGSSAMGMFGESMSVIGNNLANSNTVGYRSSRAEFHDLLAFSMGFTEAEGVNQVGSGAALSAVTTIQRQGGFEQTQVPTDLSIDGQGYFVVREYGARVGNTEGSQFYTRAGDFKRDVNGRLVTNNGMVVQGVQFNQAGAAVGPPTDVQLEETTNASVLPTSTARINVNLDATADIPSVTYDPGNANSYNYSTTVRVYDSLGVGHNVEIQFTKTAANAWSWRPVVASEELAEAHRNTSADLTVVFDVDLDGTVEDRTSGNNRVEDVPDTATYTTGNLTFNNSGYLLTEGAPPVTFNWGNGASTQQILFDFGQALDALGDATNDFGNYEDDPTATDYLMYGAGTAADDSNDANVNGSVQFASGFATRRVSQDGYAPGFLDRITVDRNGVVRGTFTNGQDRPLYQLVLASFINESALEQVGGNIFAESQRSGRPVIGNPQTDRFGTVLSNTLEQSNVDLSEEIIRMISTQRGFQANSRIVSVVDGMMEELVNLKR